MFPTLPLTSFKRDEVYSFLGGLYVASFWTLFPVCISKFSLFKSEATFESSILLIFLWLTATILIFIFSQIAYLLLILSTKSLQEKTAGELLKIINSDDAPLFYSRDVFDEQQLLIHIYVLLVVVLLLTWFSGSLFCLFWFKKTWLIYSTLSVLMLILIGASSTKRLWVNMHSISLLWSPYKELEFFDPHESAKIISNALAQFNISIINQKIAERVQAIQHNQSQPASPSPPSPHPPDPTLAM